MIRILAFILITSCAYLAPFPVFVAGMFLYVARWPGCYELLAPAVCVDLQFGLGGALYGLLYTSTTAAVILGGMALKPHLRFYH